MKSLFLLKLIGGPGSVGFLVAGCAVGLFLIFVWPRNRALGRAWLLSLFLAYIVMGLPVVSRIVAAPMDDDMAGRQPAIGAVDTLVVLDGDNVLGRIGEARRIWAASKPHVVILSGRPAIRRMLERELSGTRVGLDQASKTTREQLLYLKKYQSAHPEARLAVVASRLQMPRVIALAHQTGLQARFYSAPVDSEPARWGWAQYVPAYAALRVTRDALYERVALVYYRRQGWIPLEDPQRLTRVQ